MPRKKPTRVYFRNAKGQFVPERKRYTKVVKSVQAKRGGEYVTIIKDRTPTPTMLADLLNQREFEQLPEALVKIKDYTPKGKYSAWNIAEQIDKTKRVRRKNLKVTLRVLDGNRLKTIEFYHHIKSNQPSSYSIFRRINAEIGIEGYNLYSVVRGKHIADRKGKQVKLVDVLVEEII